LPLSNAGNVVQGSSELLPKWGSFIVSYSHARAQAHRRTPSMVDLVSIQCPHCSTPFARIARPTGGPLAVCLACGVSGDYVTLVEKGALTGLNLGQQEIQRLRFAIAALRDQAAHVELSAREKAATA
jgi:hypothetical protein